MTTCQEITKGLVLVKLRPDLGDDTVGDVQECLAAIGKELGVAFLVTLHDEIEWAKALTDDDLASVGLQRNTK